MHVWSVTCDKGARDTQSLQQVVLRKLDPPALHHIQKSTQKVRCPITIKEHSNMHVSLSIMIFQIPLNPLFLMQGHLLVVPIFLKTVLLTLLNFVYIVPMSWLIKKALL